MGNIKRKKVFKDEIIKACAKCGIEHKVAYWDDELEYYIYLEDESSDTTCPKCESIIERGKRL